VNPVVVAPAGTVTLSGTVTLALLSETDTTTPPPVAGPLSVTLQFADPGAFTLLGVQVRLLTVTGAVNPIVAVRLCPFQLTVTVADWLELRLPAVAVNVALSDPALIVTPGGTLSAPTLLPRASVTLLAEGFVRVTVQVAFSPVTRFPGVQFKPDNCAGATRFKEKVVDAPSALAVNVAA
jgi:hypothetical protein